jgi:hypothetical protein
MKKTVIKNSAIAAEQAIVLPFIPFSLLLKAC